MEQLKTRVCLADGVFVCIVDRHAVFLDLGKDDYSAIALASTKELDDEAPMEVENVLQTEFERHLPDLEAVGLLAKAGAAGGRLADFLQIPKPSGHILGRDDSRCFGLVSGRGNPPKITALDLMAFFLASWRASRLLKSRHISLIAARVKKRKKRAGSVVDIERLKRQLALFRRLRPWYPRPYLCLWEALALIEFLARRQLFPTWIFGVQVEPFGAHCWLQVDAMVLNEDSEFARQYTPIMAI